MLNSLMLATGVDIPFIEAQLTIRQPKIKEIAMIGESDFRLGTFLLGKSQKQSLDNGDSVINNYGDFELLMALLLQKDGKEYRIVVMEVLALLFPDYKIRLKKDSIVLIHKQDTENKHPKIINKDNFSEFQYIVSNMAFLNAESNKNASNIAEGSLNPADGVAKKIAEKIKAGRAKLRQLSNDKTDKDIQNIHVLEDHIRILSVGLQKDKNIFNNYTIYQLEQEYMDYIGKNNFDNYMAATLAKLSPANEVPYWMELQKCGLQ